MSIVAKRSPISATAELLQKEIALSMTDVYLKIVTAVDYLSLKLKFKLKF